MLNVHNTSNSVNWEEAGNNMKPLTESLEVASSSLLVVLLAVALLGWSSSSSSSSGRPPPNQ